MVLDFEIGGSGNGPEWWEKVIGELRELSVPEWAVDRDGKFRKRDGDGVVVFDFGKNKDEPVARNKSYLEWMISADFSPETKAFARRYLRMIEYHMSKKKRGR